MIIGMRNVLAHDYGGVDPEQVYVVVRDHLPDLTRRLEALIDQLEDEAGWQGESGQDDTPGGDR